MKLSNMPPMLAPNDAAHLGLVDAEFVGDTLLGPEFNGVQPSNLSHLLVGDRGMRVLGSGVALPAFGVGVFHVLAMRAREAMRGIAAWRVIASVKQVQAVRNWADDKFVGGAMRFQAFPIMADHAVSTGVLRSKPRPAGIGSAGLINVFPESLGKLTPSPRTAADAGARCGIGSVALEVPGFVKVGLADEFCSADGAGFSRLFAHRRASKRETVPLPRALARRSAFCIVPNSA